MGYHQVDISSKPVSMRMATATGRIKLKPETIRLVRKGEIAKGDPVPLANLMAISATKQTPNHLALTHPLRVESTEVKTRIGPSYIEVSVTVLAHEKTGVEMEALTAVSVALLNIWDAVKAYEKDEMGQYRDTAIEFIRVTRKVKKPIGA